ncbi:hypothetical protein Dda_9265 [Drechslerella dactyloides]|uniref:Uncharacterized protein n=1 Tax=Drechslerella dactyloides TaxID=74499 RepID=A0AAD6IT79_DREDA|nr:hypothetical protein Dda_9265 [Drechslerella dactyloides]
MADEDTPAFATRSIYVNLKAKPLTNICINHLCERSEANEEILSQPLISDIRSVSSYNWLAVDAGVTATPTIQVPGILSPIFCALIIYGCIRRLQADMELVMAGAPPVVTFPDTELLHLRPDSGHHFIDQNAARTNDRGMVPGLAACHAYRRTFNVQDYDIITDRNNLIKLFELVASSESPVDDLDDLFLVPRDPRGPEAGRDWRGRGGGGPGGGSSNFPRRGRGGRYRGRPRNGYRGMNPAMSRRPETSRIDIDVVSGYDHTKGTYTYDPSAASQTLILTRWEPQSEEIIVPESDFRGFGYSFLSATRQFLSVGADGEMMERSAADVTGFHCLVEYKLFGKRLLVRYHADGCDMDKKQFTNWSMGKGMRGSSGDGEDEDDEEEEETDTFDLLDAFKTLNVAGDKLQESKPLDEKPDEKPTTKVPVQVVRESLPDIPLDIVNTPNVVFPHSRLLQVKTRGRYAGLDRAKLHMQLFFSQTSQAYVAYHVSGKFPRSDARREDVTDGVKEWGEKNSKSLAHLIGLLEKVREAVVGVGGKAAVLLLPPAVAEEGNSLAVHQRR